MGQKLLIVAAAIGAMAVAGTPAVARTRTSHVGSSGVSHRTRATRADLAKISPVITPSQVVHGGYSSECTTPNGQNFFTTNTIEAVQAGNTLVSDCVANLGTPNAPKSTKGKKLTYNHQGIAYATVAGCRLYVSSGPFLAPASTGTVQGTGFTATFPSGLFVETCTAAE